MYIPMQFATYCGGLLNLHRSFFFFKEKWCDLNLAEKPCAAVIYLYLFKRDLHYSVCIANPRHYTSGGLGPWTLRYKELQICSKSRRTAIEMPFESLMS